MALYNPLDRREAEDLAYRFGIGDILDFSVMNGGLKNTSYCIETTSGRYVLTILDQMSIQHATNLVTLLRYLTDRDILTSQVIVPTNEPIVVLHDDKPVILKRYVDGDISANLSGNLLVQVGEEMARLHQIPAPSYLPKSFPYGRSHFPELENSNLRHPFIDWLSEKTRYLHENIPQDLPLTLIHGDLFFDNVIVKGDQLMAIIDYEDACHYYRGFDLGMVIVGACCDRQGVSFDRASRFMRGYQKKATLESIERETLKAFAVYAAVATSFWRFRQYHLRRPDPDLHDKHVEMQILADTISEYPESHFTELFEEKTTVVTSGREASLR